MLKSGFWKLAAPCLLIVAAAVAISFAQGDLADIVLGQGNFTSNTAYPPGAQKLFSPEGVAIDTSGNIYVADYQNSRVLGWTSGTEFANGAPADLVIGQPDFYSSACNNGNGASASSLCNPTGVAVDLSGNLYVADYTNNRVLEYNTPFAAGCSSLSPCVGQSANLVYGQEGSFTTTTANKGGVSANSLSSPYGVAVDANGHLYVADYTNDRVLEYNNPLADTTANMVFGQGGSFTSSACNNGNGTLASASSLCDPSGVAVDASGDLYVADSENNRVLEYNTPITYGTTASAVFGQNGSFSSSSCSGLSASSLCLPLAVAIDLSVSPNRLYVADEDHNRVLEYDTPLTDSTADAVLGQGGSFTSSSCNDGTAGSDVAGLGADSLCGPWGLAVDTSGNLYVADEGNNRVLEYEAPLTNGASANYVLGQPGFQYNHENFVDQYSLSAPYAVAIDLSVSPNRLYVADEANSRVLGWNDVATFTNGAPADLVIGQPNFYSTACDYDTGGAFYGSTAIDLCNPYGVAVDSSGNLYVVDEGNNRVLEYNAPVTSGASAGMVYGQSGSGNGYGNDFASNGCNFDTETGVTTADDMCEPYGVAVDGAGNLYVADTLNSRVLVYNNALTNSTANLVLGQTSFAPNSCNNNAASPSATTLCNPSGVAVDASGNLYVADEYNNRVLEYNAGFTSGAPANLVFGQGNDFTSDDCNTVSASSLCNPFGLTVDATGRLWVADEYNNRVLEYNSPLTSRTANAVFGQGGSFSSNGPNNDGVSKSSLYIPFGVALDSSNNLYVADQGNNRVLQFQSPLAAPATPTATPTPTVTTVTVTPMLAFGKVAIGQPVTKDLTVHNTGKTNSLVISSATTTDSEYALSAGTCGSIPATVAPKTSCTMGVTYTPNEVAAPGATLTLTDNAGTGSQNVALSGTGLATMTVSPASYTFGTKKNVKDGSDATTSITVHNFQTNSVSLSESFSGPNAGDFSVAGGGTCTGTLAAQSVCTLMVAFAPTATGDESATLTVADSPDPLGPYTVSFSATTTVPDSLSAKKLNFGNVAQTASKTLVSLTLTNNASTGSITLTGTTIGGGTNPSDFAVVSGGTCPLPSGSLSASSSCTYAVTFTPSTETAESGTLSIGVKEDPNGGPPAVSLVGTGLTPIKVAPPGHAFGTVKQGKSKNLTVTVTNNGGATASLSTSVSGDPTDFVVTGGTCGTPSGSVGGSGATCTYTLTFEPSSGGSKNATLNVYAVGDAASPHQISVTGTGGS